MSQELEVLKILADCVIFLISITIPTYAIAVSLLGPKYAEATERITKEKERLEGELPEMMATGTFKLEDLEKKIGSFRQKEERMKGRFNPLSLYRTVLFPNIFFGLSLGLILANIYSFSTETFPYYLGVSLFFMGTGLIALGWALRMIQMATRETTQ